MDKSALEGIPPQERKRQEVRRQSSPGSTTWLTLAGYLRVDPYREFLRSRSAARSRGLVYFVFLLRLAVAKMTSDILLKNHAFTGRKGGQGGIRQH